MHELYFIARREMNIDFYAPFFNSIKNEKDAAWKTILQNRLIHLFSNPMHGDYKKWLDAIDRIPKIRTSYSLFNDSVIKIGKKQELSEKQQNTLESCLRELIPWRKGPFNLFGIEIDSEWRSDQKWNRIQVHLPTLSGKKILDVGCGNGYYMLRMLGAGAKRVIGIEPNLLFLAQFYAVVQCLQSSVNAHLLPLKMEDLPSEINNFDYVFSMGVLYHRRTPLDHLCDLFQHTVAGGTVIIETLVVDDAYGPELKLSDRYAGMRNVWNIPSTSLVKTWLQQSGFISCTLLDTHPTCVEEQRSTSWMPYYSLSKFLDSNDSTKTIEGYPAPIRAIFSGVKPLA